MGKARVSVSILSADFGRLREEALSLGEAGADMIHLDVMDGHFVPPLTYGPAVARALHPLGLPLDVHLMVDQVPAMIHDFAPYAEYITVHAEATNHLHRILGEIRSLGLKAGVALNPATPACVLRHVIREVDLVLVMAVNPGWGGQECILEMVDKVREVRTLAHEAEVRPEIEVDGGIDSQNAHLFLDAGATILVSGTFIMGAEDRAQAIRSLR